MCGNLERRCLSLAEVAWFSHVPDEAEVLVSGETLRSGIGRSPNGKLATLVAFIALVAAGTLWYVPAGPGPRLLPRLCRL